MKVERLAIPEVLLIEPRRYADPRGFFSEVWSRRTLAEAGLDVEFVQDNHSLSTEVGVVRGLHFQKPPSAQGKLVRVVRGAILDIAVDIREGSASYGQHVARVLSADNWQQLWVPRGFAHGFCTLEPATEVAYKVDGPYAPECEDGLAWNDPALAIDWPVAPGEAQLSGKDAVLPGLPGFDSPFSYEAAW